MPASWLHGLSWHSLKCVHAPAVDYEEEDAEEGNASDDALAAAFAADAGARRQTRRPRRAQLHALSAAEVDGVDEEGEEPMAERDPDAFVEHGVLFSGFPQEPPGFACKRVGMLCKS